MLRLIAYAQDGVQRFPVGPGACIVGSQPDCDIWLPYTGVARKHARIERQGESLHIEDLGTRRGLVVNGRRVRNAVLEALDEVRLGTITLLLEDLTPELVHTPAAAPEVMPLPVSAAPAPERLIGHLARITDWVLADAESRTTLESLVRRILHDFGGGALLLLQDGAGESTTVRFAVASEAEWLTQLENLATQAAAHAGDGKNRRAAGTFAGGLAARTAWIHYRALHALDREYLLVVALPEFEPAAWQPEPAFDMLGTLLILGLVHHVGRYEPILPGAGGPAALTLAPGLVVGESPAMNEVLARLRGLADTRFNVLLRGEHGTGRELLARTLHLSSPHRQGPFVVATATGARPMQIEADLFGAVIPGRDAPVRRDGKLALDDGGTLLLEDVESLPLEVQARLVRFLRSGEVELPDAGAPALRVSVRLIATARQPLEPLVVRSQFRADLAYRLSQFAIDVPALRQRVEDLPLLIQWYVNRFCHETGKRVQGITVKALNLLLGHDLPGNLQELETIVRQMVFLCPAGRPMDSNLLPESVRQSSLRAVARVDSTSELELGRLVASTEENAIREALRRSGGNRSRTARLLGLSRNGLALKMERYGIV